MVRSKEIGITSSSTVVLMFRNFLYSSSFTAICFLKPSTLNWFISVSMIFLITLRFNFSILSHHAEPSSLNDNSPVYLYDEYLTP